MPIEADLYTSSFSLNNEQLHLVNIPFFQIVYLYLFDISQRFQNNL